MPIAIRPDGIFLKTWAIIRIITAFLLCLLIPVRFYSDICMNLQSSSLGASRQSIKSILGFLFW